MVHVQVFQQVKEVFERKEMLILGKITVLSKVLETLLGIQVNKRTLRTDIMTTGRSLL